MTRQRVIQFEYQQALVHESEHPGWSESLEISVRILAAAIYSGWYSENFGARGNDFVVLLAIAIHARPLRGEDLALLVNLGMAQLEDEGRLYARVTDLGLAAELGMSRDTIARAAERLRKLHAIDILEIPEGLVAFRDSHGQFNGSKVYLMAGDIQSRFLEKEVLNRAAKDGTVDAGWILRAAKDSTVEIGSAPRAAKSSTVGAENEPNLTLETPDRAANYPTVTAHRAAKSGINIDEEEERGGGIDSPQFSGNVDLCEQVFAHFAARKGDPSYQPLPKERAALEQMLADGYTFEQIITWIENAFAAPKKPRHFTFVAILARQVLQESHSYTPETRQPEPRTQPETRTETESDSDLSEALGIYHSTGRELTPDVLARLKRMAAHCDQAAHRDGVNGGKWLAEALEAALGIAQPDRLLNYASAVLGDWVQNGHPQRTRPTESQENLEPELEVFQQATGGRLPLPDQRQIVIQAIRERGYTAEALRPFWEAWVGRDKKRTGLDWLLDWAAKGVVPPASGFTKPDTTPQFKSLPALQNVSARYGGAQHE